MELLGEASYLVSLFFVDHPLAQASVLVLACCGVLFVLFLLLSLAAHLLPEW